MCLICIEYEKQRMTVGEARRAYSEMVSSLEPRHAKAVKAMLDRAAAKEAAAKEDAESEDP
jgi:hypothetical protein